MCSRPQWTVKLGSFTLQSCNNCKEMYKKTWCTCKVVVLPIYMYTYCFFCHSSFCHRRNCLCSLSTLQVATILVSMVPKILKLATWFVKSLPKQKELVAKWRPSKNFNLDGCLFTDTRCTSLIGDWKVTYKMFTPRPIPAVMSMMSAFISKSCVITLCTAR